MKGSRLENLEPSISYEAFVEDLDPGDSFTTTLTELLVRVRPLFTPTHTSRQPWLSLQEMAECRQRQAADRQLISDRTANGLRTLAAPQRVYRDRTGRSVAARRPLYLTDYLLPEEMDLDDDNDSLESMVDPSGTVEGARMNSDSYDAYATPGSCLSSLFSRPIRSYPISVPSLHRPTYLPYASSPASYAVLCNTKRGLGPPS